MSVITLTTDFGTRDWFVGTMKGMVLGINPRARIVDITHDVPTGDIRAGAFALAAAVRFFPKSTIHVVVVDPGVGSKRKAIAVRKEKFIFLGPDNGVLSWALAREKVTAVHALENSRYFLKPVSATFHGRDIFAPAAAHLSRGLSIEKLGSPLQDFTRLDWPEPRRRLKSIQGQIIYIDHFGNAVTNLDAKALSSLGTGPLHVHSRQTKLCPVAGFYQAVPHGKPVAVLDSSGFLEIAVNGGSAKTALHLAVGLPVAVRAERPLH